MPFLEGVLQLLTTDKVTGRSYSTTWAQFRGCKARAAWCPLALEFLSVARWMIKTCRLALRFQRLRVSACSASRASEGQIAVRQPPGPRTLQTGPTWAEMAPKTRQGRWQAGTQRGGHSQRAADSGDQFHSTRSRSLAGYDA